jgi:hypothetical protein
MPNAAECRMQKQRVFFSIQHSALLVAGTFFGQPRPPYWAA